MPRKRSQCQVILDRLYKVGIVDQAYAKRCGITRLPAYIDRIKKQGHKITSVMVNGRITYLLGGP